MHTLIHRILRLSVFCVLLITVGCSSDSGPSAVGKAYMLDAEPADAEDVSDYKASMSTGIGLGGLGGEVTIVGRVRSGGDEPWDATQATFLLTSLKTEAHDHEDGHECAFCQAQELESMTLVRVVDETGSVVPTDARKLLGLKEKQVVVATGQGMVDDRGAVLFDATRIYIRE